MHRATACRFRMTSLGKRPLYESYTGEVKYMTQVHANPKAKTGTRPTHFLALPVMFLWAFFCLFSRTHLSCFFFYVAHTRFALSLSLFFTVISFILLLLVLTLTAYCLFAIVSVQFGSFVLHGTNARNTVSVSVSAAISVVQKIMLSLPLINAHRQTHQDFHKGKTQDNIQCHNI